MGITSFNYSNYLYEFLADMVFPDTINEMNFTLKKEQMSLMPQLLVAIEKRIIEQKSKIIYYVVIDGLNQHFAMDIWLCSYACNGIYPTRTILQPEAVLLHSPAMLIFYCGQKKSK
jgi:hypothetical protein